MNLLTHTRKNSCPSLSLPAGISCPAREASMVLARKQGRVPICEKCYATTGRYRFPVVSTAQEQRLDWWRKTAPLDRALILADAMQREGLPKYFRCYDSGDLDLSASETWLRFADLLPEARIWIPTRTWLLPEYLPQLRMLNSHPRIVVRPSASGFDAPPPTIQGLSAGLASHWQEDVRADWSCPGDCSHCRVCWDQPEQSVSFKSRANEKLGTRASRRNRNQAPAR